ncbi:MAG: carbamoyltransferase HypF [Verrucomicrobiota bacterium]
MNHGTETVRKVIHLAGVVQGVGFRPALARLAADHGIGGSARNLSGKVELIVEGGREKVEIFLSELPRSLPANARLESMQTVQTVDLNGKLRKEFNILPSRSGGSFDLVIPPDLAMCSDCKREILDPGSRRYGYPFTTCTACGPRYTIIDDTPYDRQRTTMARFPMCEKCAAEYNDPADRRYHAETLACSACGPTLCFESGQGKTLKAAKALFAAREALANGEIIAVKGIGGFLLAADALNRQAVLKLRKRKQRPHKPFAVMAPDIETVRNFCMVPPAAEKALTSPGAPIVILDTRQNAATRQSIPVELITPDGPTMGIMLPTSPLHQLMFTAVKEDKTPDFKLLIMTSGNRSGEPICITNSEARDRLSGIADSFLTHNRDINLRNDDSLGTVQNGVFQLWRRARGYAPAPVNLPFKLQQTSLGMGSEMKNTVSVAQKTKVFMSPHVGDLDTPEAVDGLKEVSHNLPAFLNASPRIIATDLHPDMQSSILGSRISRDRNIPLVKIQHHYAHAAAGLAEHGLAEGLAIVFDGTGLGTDKTIWGAELLYSNMEEFRRLATFVPAALPGGDAAVINPARQLVARMHDSNIDLPAFICDKYKISPNNVRTWIRQAEKGINTPMCHSAGRLLDSFSVLLGIAPETITYDGQPAIRLEHAASACSRQIDIRVPFATEWREDTFFIDWRPAFSFMAEQISQPDPDIPALAMAVHQALADAATTMAKNTAKYTNNRNILLSGGVFMNRILTSLATRQLRNIKFKPLIHTQTPPNDACASFGQAVIAAGSVKCSMKSNENCV